MNPPGGARLRRALTSLPARISGLDGVCVFGADPTPNCAGFPAGRFTGLSSPVSQEWATGKAPKPADQNAGPTSLQNEMEAYHDPKAIIKSSYQDKLI
jgi:hypothetical protein